MGGNQCLPMYVSRSDRTLVGSNTPHFCLSRDRCSCRDNQCLSIYVSLKERTLVGYNCQRPLPDHTRPRSHVLHIARNKESNKCVSKRRTNIGRLLVGYNRSVVMSDTLYQAEIGPKTCGKTGGGQCLPRSHLKCLGMA
jgi:hypothetical protein